MGKGMGNMSSLKQVKETKHTKNHETWRNPRTERNCKGKGLKPQDLQLAPGCCRAKEEIFVSLGRKRRRSRG